jgi:hypothetical protein
MRLVVTLERDETGMVVAECPAIPGTLRALIRAAGMSVEDFAALL